MKLRSRISSNNNHRNTADKDNTMTIKTKRLFLPLAALTLSLAFPLATHADQGTLTVTLNSVGGVGMTPALSNLPASDVDITYAASDGSSQAANVQGTLTCGTSATAASAPGTYPVYKCFGLSDKGYTVVYSSASTYSVLPQSVSYSKGGLTNTVAMPPGAVFDVGWGARGCSGKYQAPAIKIQQLDQKGNAVGSASKVPCHVGKNGSPKAQTAAVYGVRDICQGWNGQFWARYSVFPFGCNYQYKPFISSNAGGDVLTSRKGFSYNNLVGESPEGILSSSLDQTTGETVLTLADGDDVWRCGNGPHPWPHYIGLTCGGKNASTLTISGNNVAQLNGTFRIMNIQPAQSAGAVSGARTHGARHHYPLAELLHIWILAPKFPPPCTACGTINISNVIDPVWIQHQLPTRVISQLGGKLAAQ